MIRKFLHLIGVVWQVLGAVAVTLAVLFLAWKIPLERREEKRYYQECNLNDGPHVLWLDDSHVKITRVWFDRASRGFRAQEEIRRVEPNSRWLKTSEGDLPLEPAGATWPCARAPSPQPAKIAAISDIHGQYRLFRKLLEVAGVVDPSGNWVWSSNQLVILGDIFDKGPSVTEALWLIKRLERQAPQSGGQVHFLLGNHDHLALRGESLTVHGKYRQTTESLHLRFQDLFGPHTELGGWVRRKDVAARINGWLFVHGGISEPLLKQRLPLEELNRLARLRLDPLALAKADLKDRALADLVGGPTGLLWHKGYFDASFPAGFLKAFRGAQEEAQAAGPVVEEALRFYGSNRMVIGHTYLRRIRTMFGGKVVAICRVQGGDDLLDRDSKGELLMIEGGQAFRVDLQGARERL
jgi:hypothetical protein